MQCNFCTWYYNWQCFYSLMSEQFVIIVYYCYNNILWRINLNALSLASWCLLKQLTTGQQTQHTTSLMGPKWCWTDSTEQGTVPLWSNTPHKNTRKHLWQTSCLFLLFNILNQGHSTLVILLYRFVIIKKWQVSRNNRKRYRCGAVYEDSGPNLASPQSHICGFLYLYQCMYSDQHLPETRV